VAFAALAGGLAEGCELRGLVQAAEKELDE
jgi:hypothetical protein